MLNLYGVRHFQGNNAGPILSPGSATLKILLKHSALDVAFVLLLVFLAYFPSLNGGFHGDDYVALLDMLTKSTSRHILDAFLFRDTDFYWRPLGHVYYNITYLIAGFDPLAFRLANLGVFMVSLVLLYSLGKGLGLSRVGAVVAILMFGLFPSGVVSVAWITNGPRLVSVMFFLCSMLSMRRAILRDSLAFEAIAWIFFVLSCLADEVGLALAPVPVALSIVMLGRHQDMRKLVWRAAAYGFVAMVLIPPQFLFTLDDEPRLAKYHVSFGIATQVWALASQLVMPLARSNPMDVPFASMGDVQWAAGFAAIALGAWLLIVGSPRTRFLVFWAAAALAPFALWNLDVVAPRYVYMAAVPFSILVGLGAEQVLMMSKRVGVEPLGIAMVAATALAVVAGGSLATFERDRDFERAIYPFEILATRLKESVPEIPPGSRVVILNGIWDYFPVWPQVVVDAEYRDPTLTVVNVPPELTGTGWPQPQPNDVVIYYSTTTGQFSPAENSLR